MVSANETPQVPPAALDAASVDSLVEMLNFLASAKDAMSDEIVTRLARTMSEGMTLLDRLTRNEGVIRMLQVLDRPETQYLLISLADALAKMSRDLATAPPAKGGILGLVQLARAPGTQEGVRALSLLGQYWNDSLRELHHRGG
ncbi:MAG: hypothetical protein EPN55_11085 [Gammaproteobacteria bacterium]|nr:MAG: hypothetical protein EPN55_11085 [Gammaproteobacteria bacterium]